MRRLHLVIETMPIFRPYSSHTKLIETMKSLGYPDIDGVCHGVACLAARYHLSDDIKTFHRHMKFTKNMRDLSINLRKPDDFSMIL